MGGSGRGRSPADASGGAWSELPGAVSKASRAGRVDRVELKIQLAPDVQTEDAIADLFRLRPRADQAREVYYLDSSDLGLYRDGLVARARLTAPGEADLVCKLRRQHAGGLPAAVRRLPRLDVELDALPDQTMWCVSLKHRIDAAQLRDLTEHQQPLAEVCSPEQLLFLSQLSDEELGGLRLFGPVSVRKLTGQLRGLGRLGVECWHYPDGRRLLELSTKCRPARVHRTARHIRQLLAEGAVELSTTQGTKTGTTLRQFAEAG